MLIKRGEHLQQPVWCLHISSNSPTLTLGPSLHPPGGSLGLGSVGREVGLTWGSVPTGRESARSHLCVCPDLPVQLSQPVAGSGAVAEPAECASLGRSWKCWSEASNFQGKWPHCAFQHTRTSLQLCQRIADPQKGRLHFGSRGPLPAVRKA